MGRADDEGKALLREFGELMAGDFNRALNNLERSLTGDHISDQVFRDYLKSLPEPDRSLKLLRRHWKPLCTT